MLRLFQAELVVLAFGLDGGGYYDFGDFVHFADVLGADHAEADVERADEVLGAVGYGAGAE